LGLTGGHHQIKQQWHLSRSKDVAFYDASKKFAGVYCH